MDTAIESPATEGTQVVEGILAGGGLSDASQGAAAFLDSAELVDSGTELSDADRALIEEVPDDIPYRDAARLRDELRTSRERWKPIESAFGSLDERARNAIIDAAPDLGQDLAVSAAVMRGLAPADRQQVLAAIDLMQRDPGQAAQVFAKFAEVLGGGQTQEAQQRARNAETGQFEAQGEQPLTRDEVARMFSEMRQQEEQSRLVQTAEQEILAEAKTLGYSPESQDPAERAEFLTLANLAASLDGDLGRAHEVMMERQQLAVERYLAKKRADAERIGPNTDAGTGPSTARDIHNVRDATASAENFLDVAFGPSGSRY